MTTNCDHWVDIDHPHGGFCTLHGNTRSLGVCRACKFNTAAPEWPPTKLPGRRSIHAARHMDCKKAREESH